MERMIKGSNSIFQAPINQKVDSAIDFAMTYPLDSDLSGGG